VDHRASLDFVVKKRISGPCLGSNKSKESVPGFSMRVSGIVMTEQYRCIIKVYYSPTDAQVNCLKNNFKIYIKIDITTAPTCFGAIIIIREGIIRACKSYSC
jgi:hypothetical protein